MKYLSIIVPVYQVERYILKCIESIYSQSLDEDSFELIIVNDGTKDNSMSLLSDFIKFHTNIIVIEQENQGLSIARNNGLAKAIGKYVLFIDSDDLLIPGTLKTLLDGAMSSSFDMVMGSFLKLTDEQIDASIYENNQRIVPKPETLSGEEAFVDFFNPRECYVWRTLYRREFLLEHQIKFISDIYFEDIPFTIECYIKAERCMSLPIDFYIYRQRPNSIVSSVNKKKICDFNVVIELLWKLKDNTPLSNKKFQKLKDTLFSTFSIEIWYLINEKGLFVYRKEIVEDLKKRVPDLFFSNGVKQIIVSFLFRYVPYTYLWFRSIFRLKVLK